MLSGAGEKRSESRRRDLLGTELRNPAPTLAEAEDPVADRATRWGSSDMRAGTSYARGLDFRAVPSGPLVIAAGQATCSDLDVSMNVRSAIRLVHRAADAGVELLVLPELFLTGYVLPAIVTHPDRYTVRPDDSRLDPLATACAATRTVLVVGAATQTPHSGALHISALVIGRDGRSAARYDKQHLDTAERTAGFSPGAVGATLLFKGWRLGLGVCWDSSFPEHARAAALDGCQAYLVGAMFDGPRGARKRDTLGPARALDNAFFFALANHNGPSGPYRGCGGSAVWQPNGELLADAAIQDPGLAVARLDPDLLARVRAEDLVLADPSLTVGSRPRALFAIA
jgi:predicted amidohydrolase